MIVSMQLVCVSACGPSTNWAPRELHAVTAAVAAGALMVATPGDSVVTRVGPCECAERPLASFTLVYHEEEGKI